MQCGLVGALLSFLTGCFCVKTATRETFPLSKVLSLKLYVALHGVVVSHRDFFTWYVILVNSHMISIQLVRVQVRAIPSGRLHLNTLLCAKFPGIFLF